jgi:NADH:ubiquinone oxidoreductase subunit 6 (subunit J)
VNGWKRFGYDMLVMFLFAFMCIVVAGQETVEVAKEFAILWLVWLVFMTVIMTVIGISLHRAMNPKVKKEENDDPPVHQ